MDTLFNIGLQLFPLGMFAVILLTFISLWKIFEKAGKPGWASIVPVYNIVILVEMAGKPIWWVILMFIPIVNIAVSIVLWHSVSQSFGRDAWYTVGLFLFPYFFLPMLAFGDAVYTAPAGAVTSTKGWVIAVVVAFGVGLVGIVFIGLLSSIVLASLSTAREKERHASMESSASYFRLDTEKYWSEKGDYQGYCNSSDAQKILETTMNLNAVCNDSASGWAISVPLTNGKFFCVDSMGKVEDSTVALGSSTSCHN